MVEYSCETVGYFSVVDGELTDPVFKTLDVEAIKKINHDGVSVDCRERVPLADNEETVNHLLQFLKKENIVEKNPGAKEFNVIARANCLMRLLAMDPRRNEAMNFKFYKHGNQNTTVVEEASFWPKREITEPSEMIQWLLSLMPDGTREEVFGSHLLFIVLKHKFVFSGGMTVNLFVSKEIHSVIKKNEEIIPIDLRENRCCEIANSAALEKFVWKAIILSFLGGGLSHLVPSAEKKYKVDRVLLFDNKNALTKGDVLNNFKNVLENFLRELTSLSDGDLAKLPTSRRGNKSVQRIQYYSDSGKWINLFVAASTFVGEGDNVRFESFAHELVILGTCNYPIRYAKHFYNADFVTLKNFRRGLFSGILKKPKSIKFYGTLEEYEKLLCLMHEDQLAKLTFVVGHD